MIASIKKHPVFFAAAMFGAVTSLFAIFLALFLPPDVIFVSGNLEWTKRLALSSALVALFVVALNYALSLYLFYRDRASAYALGFISSIAGLFMLMKVASLFYF